MRKVLLFICLSAFAIFCKAQLPPKVQLSQPVISIASDLEFLYATTADSIFVYSIPHLTLYKKSAHGLSYPVIKDFSNGKDNTRKMLLQENRVMRSPEMYNISIWADMEKHLKNNFGVRPHDSLVLWNMREDKVDYKVAGNILVDFFFTVPYGTYAMNHITNSFFSDVTRDTVFMSKNSTLYTSWWTDSGDKSFESKMDGIVKQINSIFYDRYIVLVMYYPSANQYKLVIKNPQNHSTTFESEPFLVEPKFVQSGSVEEEAFFVIQETEDNGNIYLLKSLLNKKEIPQIIPYKGKIINAYFIHSDSAIAYVTDGDWVFYNTYDKRIENKISGFADFGGFRILDALPIDGEDFLVMHSEGITEQGISNKKSVLQVKAEKDIEVFTKIEKGKIEKITSTDNFSMELNETPDFFTEVFFNSSKSYLSLANNNRLQVWETGSRKKVLDKFFDDKILAAPDASGRFIWGITSSPNGGRRLVHIDFEKGEIATSDELVITANGFLDEGGGLLEIVPVPGENNAWYVTDMNNRVMKFTGKNIEPEIYRINKRINIRSLTTDAAGNIFVNTRNYGEDVWNLYQVDFKQKKHHLIQSGRFTVLSDKNGVWIADKNEVGFWENNKFSKKITISVPWERISLNPVNNELYLSSKDANNKTVFTILNEKQQTHTLQLNSIKNYFNFLFLPNGQMVLIGEGIATYAGENMEPIPWNAAFLDNKSYRAMSVSASGKKILYGKKTIDLQSGQLQAVQDGIVSTYISDDERVELFSSGWGETHFFSLRKITGTDTILSKDKYSIPSKYVIGYGHDDFVVSKNKRWMVSYTNGIKFLSDDRATPILWDIENLQAFPFDKKYNKFSPVFPSDTASLLMINYNVEGTDVMDYKCEAAFFRLQKETSPSFVSKNIYTGNKIPYPGKYNFVSEEPGYFDWLEENSANTKKHFAAENVTCYSFNEPTQQLFGGSQNGVLHTWNINGAASPVQSINICNSGISKIEIAGNKLYAFTQNGEIGIYDISNNKILSNIQFMDFGGEQKMAVYTPDRYFNIDPEAMNSLHFVKKGKAYPLSSFEMQGNRPDKVYGAIGFAEAGYLNILKKGWETRLKRMGIMPSEKLPEPHGPVVNWDMENIPLTVSKKTFELKFKITDTSKSTLSKIFVRINGVPLHSSKGFAVPGQVQPYQFNESIQLNEGKNAISVLAINKKGEESIEQYNEIYYTDLQPTKSKILYLGIGVSAYKDSTHNLIYAAKDATDIARHIKNFGDSVTTITLTNKEADKKNILALKNVLLKTSEDEVVIVSFSGHGMIDSTGEFYFAPHDMNFNNPTINGLSMTMIEDLLDDIPARKRLLLMDACHSGEQLEGLSANAKLPEGVKEVGTKGTEKIQKKSDKEKESDRKGYMAMKELFSDFSRGNGAFMISAAASNEFALESKQWNNGVFTASFLEALYEVKDKSADKTIKVRELRKAIYEKVKQRTKGQQTPTSRQENGWWNWSF